MDRARVWPDFRASWLVYEDEDVVAVDKPVGIASQAADPSRPDDIVSRLKRHYDANGKPSYLGTHQRLDRETSGLLLYARRREANAGLAAQFEGRRVKKTYLACVRGWPAGRKSAVLRDPLTEGKNGRMEVAARPGRGAKEAVTRVREVARKGDRALLELELETGRTHQARVQLAHAGAPIAGDALYGGALAPRLMLHAARLSLEHPVGGRSLRLEAPTPEVFGEWLGGVGGEPGGGAYGYAVYDDAGALRRALEQAVERRWALGRLDEGATTAFRLVHEEGDGLPRLAVDVYGAWLVAQLYGDDGPWADAARRERLLDALGALGFDGVYLKIRPKQANVIVDAGLRNLAPPAPVRGGPAPAPLPILEEGMPLLVRLDDGLSTGLFLDQRTNRRRVRELATGLRVANLFAYTCAFSVAAALGGAASTVSVDASVAALERGRANLAHAGRLGTTHTFVADDVFRWLARAARHSERYDLVIVDPPSYSTTKRGRFVADSDYGDLARACLEIVAPGGRLLASTNHRGITPARFRRMLVAGCRAAKREAAQIKDLPPQSDYPVPAGGEPHQKSVLVTLAD